MWNAPQTEPKYHSAMLWRSHAGLATPQLQSKQRPSRPVPSCPRRPGRAPREFGAWGGRCSQVQQRSQRKERSHPHPHPRLKPLLPIYFSFCSKRPAPLSRLMQVGFTAVKSRLISSPYLVASIKTVTCPLPLRNSSSSISQSTTQHLAQDPLPPLHHTSP